MIVSERTVLVVEDDPNDALFVERAFQKAGRPNAVRVAGDVAGAIAYVSGLERFSDRAKNPFPSIVLLDLKLPGKGGFDFLQWFRSRAEFRHVPVLVFTSSRQKEDMTRACELGATAYLVKPSGSDELQELVESIVSFWLTFATFPT